MKVVDRNGVEILPGVKLAWASHSGEYFLLKIGVVQDIKILPQPDRPWGGKGYDVIIRAPIQDYAYWSGEKTRKYLARLPESFYISDGEDDPTELRVRRAEVVG